VKTIIGLSRHDSSTRDSEGDLRDTITTGLRRWPSAGAAVAVVCRGSPVQYFCHGVADVATRRPIGEGTVFRIGSLTKTITAVAVMQLCEQGPVDLDAPANDYLRAFQLVPANAGFGPATVRHLLTHTAGIGYWRRRSDLLFHLGAGSGVTARSVVPLPEYYRGGLTIDVEPGTRWAYSNHGFAALGQVVEDVSGEPFGQYLRDHIFGPLGMDHTGLALSGQLRADLATGYTLRRRGLRPVTPREVPTPAGGVYSTPADMARYLTALLRGGANEHGRVLSADSVQAMFRPHFQPDPRVPGMALGFEPHIERGRVLICKGGTISGFLSALELAPEAGVGVVVLTNTGGLDNRGMPEPVAAALTRRLLGMPGNPCPQRRRPPPGGVGRAARLVRTRRWPGHEPVRAGRVWCRGRGGRPPPPSDAEAADPGAWPMGRDGAASRRLRRSAGIPRQVPQL
jgi:CubicO group peptidase (beta-lactamase class C family)